MFPKTTICVLSLLLAGEAFSGVLSFESRTLALPCEKGVDTVKGVFKFKNGGLAPVTILDLNSSCGCTTAELAKKTYAPGESGTVDVLFNLDGLEGRQSRAIIVRTDENVENEYPLTIETEAAPLVAIEPRILSWKYDEAPEPKYIQVALRSAGELVYAGTIDPKDKFGIETISSSEAGFKLKITPRSTKSGVVSRTTLQFRTKAGTNTKRAVLLVVLPDPGLAQKYRPSKDAEN